MHSGGRRCERRSSAEPADKPDGGGKSRRGRRGSILLLLNAVFCVGMRRLRRVSLVPWSVGRRRGRLSFSLESTEELARFVHQRMRESRSVGIECPGGNAQLFRCLAPADHRGDHSKVTAELRSIGWSRPTKRVVPCQSICTSRLMSWDVGCAGADVFRQGSNPVRRCPEPRDSRADHAVGGRRPRWRECRMRPWGHRAQGATRCRGSRRDGWPYPASRCRVSAGPTRGPGRACAGRGRRRAVRRRSCSLK